MKTNYGKGLQTYKTKLTPITSPKPSPPFQVLDIETMNWTRFIVLGFYTGEKYHEFRTLKKFADFIKQQKQGLNCFAHFGGKFDFLFLLKTVLEDSDFKVQNIIPRGSSILGLEIHVNEIKHNFRDSSALLPFALKSLSQNFGVKTQKTEWDHTKTKGYSAKLSEYLRHDCEALYQCLEAFYSWPLIQKSGPAYTMASQALKVFRTFIQEPIPSLGVNATAFCRKAYLGGRTEIFKMKYEGEALYEYDVNSLYPFVMAQHPYPVDTGYGCFTRNKSKLGIYHARAICPSNTYLPCLGLIQDNKYIFPTGSFEGHWTGFELDYAETQGYKIKIIRGHEFNTKKYLFKEYVDALYSIRESSPKNSVSNILAKLLMNSLYGRFGLNLDRENICFELKEGNKEYAIIKTPKRNIQLWKVPVTIQSFSHVGIAAHVTSYARVHMHKIMRGKDIYYTDTDSIFTTDKLPESSLLGGLKKEHVYNSACFLLPKTYQARSDTKVKTAMKGFDSKKINQFSFEDFQNCLEGDMARMKITNEPKFASLKTALAQQKVVTMTKGSTKQLRSMYSKRLIINGGTDTKPIHLQE